MIRDIKPVKIYASRAATKLGIGRVSVAPNVSASGGWMLYFDNGEAGLEYAGIGGDFLLAGEAYADWGSDDEYLANFVADKEGFVIVP